MFSCQLFEISKNTFFTEQLWTTVSNTVKPLISGQLQALKNLSVIERCSLVESNLKKAVTFGTKYFARYSWHFRYLGCPLLGGFTVTPSHNHLICCSQMTLDLLISAIAYIIDLAHRKIRRIPSIRQVKINKKLRQVFSD